jgi:hypothetical protein
MNPNPFSLLLHSRKFWLALFDLVLGFATYFVSKYAPTASADVQFAFAAIQPMFLVLIASIAWEDVNRS